MGETSPEVKVHLTYCFTSWYYQNTFKIPVEQNTFSKLNLINSNVIPYQQILFMNPLYMLILSKHLPSMCDLVTIVLSFISLLSSLSGIILH